MMAKAVGKIALDPKPMKVGREWHVLVTYPSGEREHIAGFKSEVDALDWIAEESKAWLAKRGYGIRE
jgi:hypothetical protein